MEEDTGERRGFQVKDRRRFSETGEARPGVSEEASSPAAADSTAQAVPVDAPQEDEPVTFSTFVLGLSTQALLHLGEIANPVTRAVEPDLAAAKQVIDILGIIQKKTHDNLEQGEQSLLESVLYDLRMRYVELVRRGVKEGA